MPLNIPKDLPAVDELKKENIFVKDSIEAANQDIRPLKIVILNLMPIKITTETDLIRLLSNSPLQIEIEFMQISSHTSKHTPIEHMMAFYKSFETLKTQKFDGMIITGAPLEFMDYEEVTYWNELTEIFDWARTHVTSTLYVCWGAFAALYHFYGINKKMTDSKIFGVYKHKILDEFNPIFRGFDSEFYVPHSRHCTLDREDVEAVPDLKILAEGKVKVKRKIGKQEVLMDGPGPYMMMANNGREFFLTGHPEYSPYTLDTEYRRDLEKGLPIEPPYNYYKINNPQMGPQVRWRSYANLFYTNWLNYFVYQITPYDINLVK